MRVDELVQLGLIDLEGNIVSDLPTDGRPSHDHDLVYIKLDGSSPPTFGVVDFGADVLFSNDVGVLWKNAASVDVEAIVLSSVQIGSIAESIPDIDTLAYDSVSTAADLDDDPFGMWFTADGLTVFVGSLTTNTIQKYALGTAWDITTLGPQLQESITLGTGANYYPTGVALNPDGTKVFVGVYVNGDIQTHTLSVPYDLSTLSATPDSGETLSVWTGSNLTGIYFSQDGLNLAAVSDGSIVKTYLLSSAFVLSTASLIGTIDISANPSNSNGLAMSNDGAKMWMLIRGTGRLIYQYTLSTPWDASTAVYDSKFYLTTYNVGSPNLTGPFIEPSRGEFYFLSKPGPVNTAVIEKATFTPQGLIPIYEETFVVGDPDYRLDLDGNQVTVRSSLKLESPNGVFGYTMTVTDADGAWTVTADNPYTKEYYSVFDIGGFLSVKSPAVFDTQATPGIPSLGDAFFVGLAFISADDTTIADISYSGDDVLQFGGYVSGGDTAFYVTEITGTPGSYTYDFQYSLVMDQSEKRISVGETGWGLRIGTGSSYVTAPTDYADFSHDGTDFNTDFTNTADWNITGLTGFMGLPGLRLLNGIYSHTITQTAFGWLDVRPNAAAENLGIYFYEMDTFGIYAPDGSTSSPPVASDTPNAAVTFWGVTDDVFLGILGFSTGSNLTFQNFIHGADITFHVQNDAGAGFIPLVIDPDALSVSVGAGFSLRVSNTAGDDYADFSHDGTDFNTDFTNTADWNVTGVTNLQLGAANIVLSGTVDGVDVSAHAADGTLHFTQGAISIPASQISDFGTAVLAIAPVTATTTELEAIANAINTSALKVQGYQVYNTTDDRPVWAADDTDGGLWNYADGTLAHTPVA